MGASLIWGTSTGGSWTKQEKETRHINELELLAAELAIKLSQKNGNPSRSTYILTIYLHYLVQKGGTKRVQVYQ